MKTSDRPKFVEVVVGFAEIRGKELSDGAIELYWRTMRDWPLDEFIEAAEHLLRTCEWFPTPKHFEDLRKASTPGPAEAWEQALGLCTKWRSPEQLPTGLVARAAACIGGFRAIAMCDVNRDLPHLQRRFMDAYEELRANTSVRESLPQLADRSKLAPRINHGMQSLGRALDGVKLAGKQRETEPEASA